MVKRAITDSDGSGKIRWKGKTGINNFMGIWPLRVTENKMSNIGRLNLRENVAMTLKLHRLREAVIEH